MSDAVFYKNEQRTRHKYFYKLVWCSKMSEKIWSDFEQFLIKKFMFEVYKILKKRCFLAVFNDVLAFTDDDILQMGLEKSNFSRNVLSSN